MIVKYLIKKWPFLSAYIAVIIVAPIVHARCGFVSADMIDYAEAANLQAFLKTLSVFLIYFVAHGVLLFAIQAFRARLVSYCRRDVRKDMLERIIYTDNSFFSKPDTGFHIAAFTNDITILETKYFSTWLETIESLLAVATSAVAIFTLDRTMAIIIFIGQAFSIALCYFVRKYSINKNRIYIENLANFTQKIKDFFSAFQTVKNYSVENQIKKRFARINTDTEQSKNEADSAIAFADILAQVCNSMIRFVIVIYGVVMMIQGKITLGLIYAAFQFSNQLVAPMFSIITKINAIESVKSIVYRIKTITQEAKKEDQQKDIVLNEPATIKLEGITIELSGKTVLDHITYTFLPGKKYLIIGGNGAGKSTLLKLLKRSTANFEGSISINGHDIREFSYKSLSGVVSYINESVSLICDSVKENIALYRDVTDEQIQRAVDTVGLKVDLNRIVRDGERNLSSGETRRIEIARSLIDQTSVIIYDEAISTLDIPTAYEIEKTLFSLKDQMVIFVSHNFSSQLINEYDEILLLDNGKLIGVGSHEELMNSSDYYRRIMSIKNG